MLNVLIVDDEPLAHDVIAHHCRTMADLHVTAHAYSAGEALAALAEHRIDLMFLDVRMPRFGGVDLLRGLAAPPLTVIVSAHREHAIEGFELDVIDYLLKPVSAARLADAIDKVRRRLATARSPAPPAQPQDIVLKVGRAMQRFAHDRILCCEGQGNYVLVRTASGDTLTTITLKALRDALPGDQFVQVHKSFIVRREAIAAQDVRSLRLVDGTLIPIGKTFRGTDFLTG